MIGLWMLTLACALPAQDDKKLDAVRDLLVRYHRETLSSRVMDKPSVLDEIRALKPELELLELYRRRDPSVSRLAGTFWAIVCREVQPKSFVGYLLADLEHEDPGMRAEACEALGYLGERSVIPVLKEKLKDARVVEGFFGSPPVSSFAASALALLGCADGVLPLLARDEAMAKAHPGWKSVSAHHYRRYSGEDYGIDLAKWRAHFDKHPPRLAK